METQSKLNRNWLWGALLIALGVIFLLNQILPGLFSSLVWASAFALGAVAVYGYYARNKSQWWALIPAYVMGVIAVLIATGPLNFVPGEFIGAFVMFAIGFPFLYVYLRNKEHWWALIPAYTMGAIGVLILATMILNGNLIASYVFFAVALPFFYVYVRNRNHWWALIPGGIMGMMGLAFLIAGIAYLIPAAMIIVGIYLLVRQFSGKEKAEKKQIPAEKPQIPQTGPEADKPVREFEPIGVSNMHNDEPTE